MITTCRNCGRDYDTSHIDEGKPIRCECGDIIMIVDPKERDGLELVRTHIARLVKDEGLPIADVASASKWEFQRGSARIEIHLEADGSHVTAASSVIPLPTDEKRQLELFRKVLALNAKATGDAKFAIEGDELVVVFSRSTVGLDYVEFHAGLEDVCQVADDYDDILRAEFLGITENSESEDEEIDLSKFIK